MQISLRSTGPLFLQPECAPWQYLSAARALLVRCVAEVLCMAHTMLVRRNDFQILRMVVQLVAILVVDVLIALERTTEYLLHHATVFSSPLVVRADVAVARLAMNGPAPPLAFSRARATMP